MGLRAPGPLEHAPVPMQIYIALLRAINVAGHRPVGMGDLRGLLSALGLGDPRSLLQTGNLVFRTVARPSGELEGLLETEAEKRLGLTTDFFVRTVAEWKALIGANPFLEEARGDPGHLVVQLLKAAPTAANVASLQAAITGREVLRIKDRHAYVVYPDGIGRSRLTNALLEKKLGTRATGRNWNTVLKLGALTEG